MICAVPSSYPLPLSLPHFWICSIYNVNISFENSTSFLSGLSYFPEQSHPSHTLLFIYLKNIYLFLAGSSLLCGLFFGCSKWGLLSGCNAQASHCGGFSCPGARGLGWPGFSSYDSGASERRLSSYGTWA